jgi:hypothetical protein
MCERIMNKDIPGFPVMTIGLVVGFFSFPKEIPGKCLDADRNQNIPHPQLLAIHESEPHIDLCKPYTAEGVLLDDANIFVTTIAVVLSISSLCSTCGYLLVPGLKFLSQLTINPTLSLSSASLLMYNAFPS